MALAWELLQEAGAWGASPAAGAWEGGPQEVAPGEGGGSLQLPSCLGAEAPGPGQAEVQSPGAPVGRPQTAGEVCPPGGHIVGIVKFSQANSTGLQ